MKNLKIVGAIATTLFASQAQAKPAQCWFYLHNGLKGVSIEQCVKKAEAAFAARDLLSKTKNSDDQYLTVIKAHSDTISADIICYEVNGERGKVMAFITVAGTSACSVAKNLHTKMKSKPH